MGSGKMEYKINGQGVKEKRQSKVQVKKNNHATVLVEIVTVQV